MVVKFPVAEVYVSGVCDAVFVFFGSSFVCGYVVVGELKWFFDEVC